MQGPFKTTNDMLREINEEAIADAYDAPRTGTRHSGIPREALDPLHSEGPTPNPRYDQPIVRAVEPPQASTEEDAINPSHYRKHPSGIECIEITRHMNFNVGNAIKYIWRHMDKGDPVENLQKAQWYIDDEIRRLQGMR